MRDVHAGISEPTAAGGGGPQFRATLEREDDTATLRLEGELDIAAKEELETRLGEALRAQPGAVVVDLRPLRFIDSTGLGAILGIWMRAEEEGFGLTILPGPPDVQRTFEITGLLRRLPFAG
jgi:anti-anti-sigma factor